MWDENVINNEGLGRKSSKRCCIFHKKKEFGESDTESDSDFEFDANEEDKGRKKKDGSNIKGFGEAGKQKTPDFQRFHA